MAELITFDDTSSLNLDDNSKDAKAFHHQLYILNEISIQLSKTKSLNELYQQAIILANQKLGFERIGILRFDSQTQTMSGTWGIDSEGIARDESNYTLIIDDEIKHGLDVLGRKGKVCLWLNREIQEFSEQHDTNENIGLGWNAAFAFWEDDKMLGWVACDNLFSKQDFPPYRSHILRLLGTLIGELILLKQTQQEVLILNSVLEDKVSQRTHELYISQKKLQQSYQQLEDKVLQRTEALATEKEKLQDTLNKLLSTEHSLDKSQKIQQFLKQDISSLYEMQEALREANIRAEAANTTKSHFITNISHELKTPMNAIIGNLNFLSASSLDTKQQRYLEKASDASNHLMSLIQDLLSFSTTSQQKDELDIQKNSIDSIISDTLAFFAEKALQKNIALHCHIDRQVPISIYCDANKVKMVINNLLDNAIKFTHQGNILLKLSWIENEEKTDQLQLLVKDTGIGIEAKYLPSLFDSFNAFDSADDRSFDGVGIGLSLVEKQCRAMGADIDVHSQIGSGSSFIINIPSSRSAQSLTPQITDAILLVATDPILIDLMIRTGLNYQQTDDLSNAPKTLQYKLIIIQSSLSINAQDNRDNLLIVHQQKQHSILNKNELSLPFTSVYLLEAITSFLHSDNIVTIEEKEEAPVNILSVAQQQEQLNHILNLCQDNNIDAIEYTEQLLNHFQETPQHALTAPLHKLLSYLQSFDFDNAMSLIKKLCSP